MIEALIAEGGMGAVYRARNRVTGQLRALKIVREELVRNREFIDRFVREATIASALRHPNLVETLEPGMEGSTIYLPMELLVGETLASRLRRMKRMSAHETAMILAPLCEAVQLLHDQKLVHRDLKPGNVYIANVGGHDVPKVIDLGTTRDVEDAEHTVTGMVVGSPYYMAPEQAEGRRDVDGRADQYALGVVAYQMVTGARPYESDDTRSALAKLMRGDPYIPPSRVFAGVPGPVEAAIVRALSREREARFPRVVDFGRALAAAASGMGDVATVGDLSEAVEQAKAVIAARPVLTVGGGAETQIREVETPPMAPTPTPAFAAPPPTASSAPASSGGNGIVIAIGVVALLAVLGAAGMWLLASREAQATQPRAVELAPTSVAIVPPTSVAIPPPVTGVPVTEVAPPTSVELAPPATTAPATTAPPTTAVAAEHAPPPTASEHEHTHHRERPPATTTAACGAATGIPCVE